MRTRSLAVPTSSTAGSQLTRDRLRLMLTVSAVLGAALLWFSAGAHAGNVPPATESAPPPAMGEHPMGDHRMRQKGHHFKKLDKDGNGSLSKAELEQGAPRMAGHFDELDANKDGSVSREEMRAAHQRMHENMQAHKAERFEAADTDKNGSLSKAEVEANMQRLAPKFDTLDTNKDGQLSRAELDAWHHGKMKS